MDIQQKRASLCSVGRPGDIRYTTLSSHSTTPISSNISLIRQGDGGNYFQLELFSFKVYSFLLDGYTTKKSISMLLLHLCYHIYSAVKDNYKTALYRILVFSSRGGHINVRIL